MSNNGDDTRDKESNRLIGRAERYAKVSAGIGTAAARIAGRRMMPGMASDKASEAKLLRNALGGLKGPLMKVAQLMATVPDALPMEYAAELASLQSQAPAMGWPFVRRRMAAELGSDWQSKFAHFEQDAAAAASLGQVHRAQSLQGEALACKLQYPDMQSAVEADLQQLQLIFAIHRRMDPALGTSEVAQEIADRLREELDYQREAKHIGLYRKVLADADNITVPKVIDELSSKRLLTMNWLDGKPLLDFKQADLSIRNLLAEAMFAAWWQPFCGHGIIHGDPHLGNYSARLENDVPTGINLLDFGCIRIFPAKFVLGVVELYRGLLNDDRAQMVAAYEIWGFQNLTNELIDILNIWARFIYGPLMQDKVQSLVGEGSAAEYGRKQAMLVHNQLKAKGPVTIPREFVFMDRAAIGLGGVFIHLRAELNFYQLFNKAIENFSLDGVAERQASALKQAGLEPINSQ